MKACASSVLSPWCESRRSANETPWLAEMRPIPLRDVRGDGQRQGIDQRVQILQLAERQNAQTVRKLEREGNKRKVKHRRKVKQGE